MSNKSLRIQAYNWLKLKIITLEYPMGSALAEADICNELGMGRTPIREALQQLAAEKLVSIRPRKGTFVSNVNFWDFEKLLDARIMLEIHVVRKLVGKITPDQVGMLQQPFAEVPALIEQRDINGLLAIDRAFHQGLVALLDNPYLNDMADHIYDFVIRSWYLSFRNRSQRDLANTLQDHLDLLTMLEQGEAEAVEKAVHEHVMNFRSKVYNLLQE